MTLQKSMTDILNKVFTGNSISIDGNTNSTFSASTIAALSAAIGSAVAAAIFLTASTTSLPVNPVTVVATATVSVSPVITTSSVKIVNANPARKALVLYNNSANSVYLSTATPATSGTNLFYILPTFTQVSLTQLMPNTVYTGAIYGIRNAGTGSVVVTEFTL